MLSELKLTDDEVAEAARLLLAGVQFTTPKVTARAHEEARHSIKMTVKIMSAIAQVVDNRKEKEIG